MKAWTPRTRRLITFAWLVALVATLGSLFFSEVMGLAPCVLCWYQRIAMYPLVVILLVAILEHKPDIYRYVLPLSLSGLAVSVYHNLLYYHLIPESTAPCSAGVSCTTRYLDWLGFITIPLLALTAFVLITVSMLVLRHVCRRGSRRQARTAAR